jgi:carboxymethylenebutenolidase
MGSAAIVAARAADPDGARAGAQTPAIPPGGPDAAARLAASPRGGEWVMIRSGQDSVRAWVVYPARRENAGVVVAVHDNRGMSDWIRSVADQLAADGFIGIAPDLLTLRMADVPRVASGDSEPEAVRAVLNQIDQSTRDRLIRIAGEWGTRQQGASSSYGIVGFCWGGSTVFSHAVAAPPALGAVVVYYGSSPSPAQLTSVRAPVLGLYGENDARINVTVPPADSALKAMGRTFEQHTFAGAGHGFLRGQDGQNGANLEASRQAWPLTVRFFREHLK